MYRINSVRIRLFCHLQAVWLLVPLKNITPTSFGFKNNNPNTFVKNYQKEWSLEYCEAKPSD